MGHQRDFKLTVFSFDNDSNLNTDEGKEKLRKVGLKDELDVGRWIAEKLQDYEQNDVSQNVIKFIAGKEESTLNSNRVSMHIFINQHTNVPLTSFSLISVVNNGFQAF